MLQSCPVQRAHVESNICRAAAVVVRWPAAKLRVIVKSGWQCRQVITKSGETYIICICICICICRGGAVAVVVRWPAAKLRIIVKSGGADKLLQRVEKPTLWGGWTMVTLPLP